MKSVYQILIFVFIASLDLTPCYGQTISKDKLSINKVKFSGGINLLSQFYNVKGLDPRRSPFSWVIAGNAMISVGKFKLPFRFSFRDQKFNYGGPSFNKFGISPKYKWARLHLGYRAMKFSKYTLNRKTFFGVGIELKPKLLRLSAFKGKLKNPLAQKDTLVFGGVLISTYNRDAYGVKIGIGNRNNFFDLSYLKVKDNIDNIDSIIRYPNIKPVENLVLGADWKLLISKTISLTGSVNTSAYSENLSLPEFKVDSKLFSFFDKIYNVNSSTKLSFAGDLALNMNLRNFNLGLQFRRIEPNYRSLGISFLQADVQSYTANTNINLFKRKLLLSAQVGIERNNLRNLDYLSRKRFIHSYRANYTPSSGFNIMAHFANYQYESTDGLVAINDTLRQVSISRLAGLNMSYNHKTDTKTYGTFVSFQRQIVRDQSPVFNIGADILNNNFSIGGVIKWNNRNLSLRPSINFSNFKIIENSQYRYGVGLNIKKSFLNKMLSLNFNSQYSLNSINNTKNGFVFSNRLSAQYKINKKHILKFRAGLMRKSAIIGKSFNEFRSTLQYSLKF